MKKLFIVCTLFVSLPAIAEVTCDSQVPDVAAKYNITYVKWIPDEQPDYLSRVLCDYMAYKVTEDGNIPVLVVAGLGRPDIGYIIKDNRNTFSIKYDRMFK